MSGYDPDRVSGRLSLFSENSCIDTKSGQLMTVTDTINGLHGRHTIRYASEGLDRK
jgi:Domain of unknown function (DUF4113)